MTDPGAPVEAGRGPDARSGDLDRLHAELDELRQASRKLLWSRAAADAVSEATIRASEDGIILEVNRACCEMHGWTREELLGQHITSLHALGTPRFEDVQPLLEAQRSAHFGAVHRRRDGSTFPVQVHLSIIEIDGERQSLGVVKDLSEQARHEATVRAIASGVSAKAGHEFFRTLLGQLAGALDADYAFVGEYRPGPPPQVRMIAMTHHGEPHPAGDYTLAGTPCENVIGRDVCAWPRDIQAAFPTDAALVEMGAEGYAGVPLTRSDGAPLGLMAIVTCRPIEDVPRVESLLQIFAARAASELERLQSEQALHRSEALLRELIDHTPAVVLIKDVEGRLLLANREFERKSGEPLAESLGRVVLEQFEDETARRLLANDQAVLEARRPLQFEEEVVTRAGARRTYIADKLPLLDATGTPYALCTIATDITERKAIEARLREVQRLESVGVLAGGVAHDFNNLLTAIQGYTDLAIQEAGEGSEVGRLLAEAQSASRRAAGLTRQLLAFARRQALAPRRVELRPAIDEVAALLRPLTGERIRVVVTVPGGLWAVHADPGQLEQVLVHLMVHARDAMPAGGTLAFEAENVTLAAGQEPPGSGLPLGEYVALRVRDTGEGMPPEVSSRVFDPFFTSRGPGRGAGIGLATSHGIVRQGGGHIWVTSEPGHGTTFHLLLPRDASAEANGAAPGASGGGARILLVEDEPLVRALAARALRDAGYTVSEAASGEEAVARLAAEVVPDLVLTDVVMPGLSGTELAERALAAHPGLPVVFMSGYADETLRERVRASRAVLLDKPYAPSALVAAVRNALLAR